MCGIAGVFSKKSLDYDTIVSSMTNCLSHRGPDSKKVHIGKNMAMGHTRLSIIDLTEFANQPFFDSTGRYTLVFNGEIYNYAKLKYDLKDYNFITNSDTEVVLAYFIKFGFKCVNHFDGFFAFAIWDSLSQTVFIARDRLGVKPIYYYFKDDILIIASEIRSILSIKQVSKDINYQSVFDTLVYGSSIEPDTMITDIKMLPPANYASFDFQSFTIMKYWDLCPNKIEKIDIPYNEIKKNIKNLFYNSIEKRLVSDVNVGCFLSGGIDSTLIAGVMTEVANKRIDTFSMIFDEQNQNEEEYIDIASNTFNTIQHKIKFNNGLIIYYFNEVLNSIDSPSIDGFNTYFISKFAKEMGSSVILSGIGSDEIFCGYNSFKKSELLYKINKFIPKNLVPIIALFLKGNKKDRLSKILMSEQSIEIIYGEIRKLITQSEFFKYVNFEHFTDKYSLNKEMACNELPFLSRYSINELNKYTLNTLIKDADQYSMASALEIREPFLDYQLIEYVLSLPDLYKTKSGVKGLLTDSIPILPKKIIERKKRGFVLPWAKLIKNELREEFIFNLKYLENFNFFNIDQILFDFNIFCRSNNNNYHIFYSLMILGNWYKKNIPVNK